MVDGSTSKTPNRINPDITNGKFCMELVKQYIERMPMDTDVKSFCRGITDFIRSTYNKFNVNLTKLELNPAERLTASTVVYSHYLKQIWMIGDCQCLVNGAYYDNPKPQEKILAEKRALFLARLINNGASIKDIQTNDSGRNFILEELTECCKWQNISYSVIDGFDIPFDKVRIINASGCNEEIILATDGYPFLKKTLAASESALAEQLRNDPLCIRTFKATKGLMVGNVSFDDRAYLKIIDDMP